jgi:hypothetical protein
MSDIPKLSKRLVPLLIIGVHPRTPETAFELGTTMALSIRKVETAKPGRHSDGQGLLLLVKASGARSWVLQYQIKGRRRDMGLGAWPQVSLAKAR